MWDRVQFENAMVPSTDALYRHWMRACWVIDKWHQASNNEMVVQPLVEYGWKLDGEMLSFDWDSSANMEAVRERVAGLTRGCHCRTGCGTSRCGCKGKGKSCSEGCKCTNCSNTQDALHRDSTDDLLEISVEEIIADENQTEVNDIMDWVFGNSESFEEEFDQDDLDD